MTANLGVFRDVRIGSFASHDTDALLRGALEAGACGLLLKSDAKRYRIAAAESLAAHRPFSQTAILRKLNIETTAGLVRYAVRYKPVEA